MKNAGVRSTRNGLFEEGLRGNKVNATKDVLSPFDLGWRLEQRNHPWSFDWTSQIERVGTFFRRLETLKHS